MFNRLNVTPGFILVLHTFGRDLKWNPHIHCILTAGGYSTKTKEWKNINHFNFKLLRKSFMYILLKSLDVDKKVYLNCYKDHKNGFYVYAKENNINTKVISSYISRYLGRPCKHLQE